MTYRELQAMFELKATSLYGAIDTKPSSSEIEMWLNSGLNKLIKTRYSGINYKGLGYEQDQKRIEDLRNLKTSILLPLDSNPTYNSNPKYIVYNFTLPSNYFIATGESVTILPITDEAKKCWEKDGNTYVPTFTTLIECTDDNIDEKLSSNLSDHLFHGIKTRPLRVHNNGVISVYTDGEYSVNTFQLVYLKKPNKIDIHSNPTDDYTDFPEYLIEEIVNLGVQLYLENKEKQRYNTFSAENALTE